jgi:alpha-glucosidase
MRSSQVCGFLSSAKEKMCARWATLGAFNPFYRNHADDRSPHQEFYLWPLVARAARHAIDIRYRLLDYLYTALARQSADGTPTLNPMWYIYPQDEQTFPIDLQFFYGDCILVSPVTKDDSTDVSIYLPDDQFYDFVTRKPVRGRGEWVDLKGIPFDRIPLHVRGGCIVPLRAESANTTTELRKKEFEILVAPGLDGVARGSLYVDDGETLDGGSHKAQVEFEYSAEEGLKTQIIPLSSSRPDLSLAEAGVKIAKITVLGEEPEGDDSDWDEL